MSYEPLYVAYLVYFNRDRDYFECHEVLEELWLERDHDPLYKGLLQVAVGLFHARSGNVSGGRKMLLSALERLAPYPEGALGIDLGKLRRETAVYAEALEPGQVRFFAYYDLTIDIVEPALRDTMEQAAGAIAPNVPQRRKPQRGDKHEERRLKLEERQRELNG